MRVLDHAAIFTLIAIAGVLAGRGARAGAQRRLLLEVYLLNAALNVLWSLLFFYLQRSEWAMVGVVALWLSVALMMLLSRWLAGIAPRFMLPYLLWVGFAAWLNLAIIRLDGAFG